MEYPLELSIINPGAETGDATGWSNLFGSGPGNVSSGSLPDGSAHSGTRYFSASASVARSWWGQTVEISDEEVIADIDAGILSAELSAWRNGFSDDDEACLIIDFFNSSGAGSDANWLAGKSSDFSDPSVWTKETVTLPIPPGTRFIRISARGNRLAGSESSAYFDDFGLRLIVEPKVNDILFSMADGSTSGWTNVSGTLAAPVTRGYGDAATQWNDALGHSYRDIAIPSGWLAHVDAGNTKADLLYWQYAFDNSDNDTGRTYLEFYDGGNSIIGTRIYSDPSEFSALARGVPKQVLQDIPANARTIRIGLMGTRMSGVGLDANFSRMALLIERAGAPTALELQADISDDLGLSAEIDIPPLPVELFAAISDDLGLAASLTITSPPAALDLSADISDDGGLSADLSLSSEPGSPSGFVPPVQVVVICV